MTKKSRIETLSKLFWPSVKATRRREGKELQPVFRLIDGGQREEGNQPIAVSRLVNEHGTVDMNRPLDQNRGRRKTCIGFDLSYWTCASF